MPDYILLMHDDAVDSRSAGNNDRWGAYLAKLRASGNFEGGSAIGTGVCVRKSGMAPQLTGHLTGFIRVRADSLEHALTFLIGNPVFESGGAVEIRELPQTD